MENIKNPSKNHETTYHSEKSYTKSHYVSEASREFLSFFSKLIAIENWIKDLDINQISEKALTEKNVSVSVCKSLPNPLFLIEIWYIPAPNTLLCVCRGNFINTMLDLSEISIF